MGKKRRANIILTAFHVNIPSCWSKYGVMMTLKVTRGIHQWIIWEVDRITGELLIIG
jgi:hypothetical protein